MATGKYLCWSKARQATVMVLEVVPIEVVMAPLLSMRDVVKASRVVWLVLLSFELAFAECVVVAHARPAMAASDIELVHQVQIAMSYHW